MTYKYTNAVNGKLQPSAFYQLPAGAVRPDGFLRRQLILLAEGLTGEMELFPDYRPETSEWRGGAGENWERGPYYLRGLVALAYVLDDEKLKEKAQSWIESILASVREDGMFGPRSNEDWWSRMPVLMALRDYYEAKLMREEEDTRIIPFMENYFRGQLKLLPNRPLESWARARGGDNIDSVLWLYQKLYDPAHPDETDWLIELANLLASQTQDWVNIMQETTVREHVVNTSQAMKTPPLLWQISGEERAKTALQQGLAHITIDHGRIDELPNSDEAARDNLSHRGSELCGIVEGMLSSEIAIRILGDPTLCDHLETLAYNALPSGYSYDYLGHVYYILQNQVLATNGYHGFDCDHGDSSAFGAPCGFDCCFSNHHMGWPKFVQSMWMATPEGGLATIAYGPCSVNATVAGTKTASFQMTTDYPFREKVTLTYTGEEATFPLKLRIPGWSQETTLSINGCPSKLTSPAGIFRQITRTWMNGDTVELVFTAKVKLSTWYNRSVGVRRGALIYSYPIGESWRELADNACRELKVPALGKTRNREVLPVSAWNMSILPTESDFAVTEAPVTDHPFTPDSAPLRLSVRMKKRPDWRLAGNVPAPQPCGCCTGKTVDADLIPYGSTRLKLTHILSAEPMDEDITVPAIIEENASVFGQLVLPKAYAYELSVSGAPRATATLSINGQQAGSVCLDGNGTYTRVIAGDDCTSNPFRFTPEQYNVIRIDGAIVSKLTIRPVGTPIISATLHRFPDAIGVATNADPRLGSIFGEFRDGEGNVLLTVRNLQKQNRLPPVYPEAASALRISQRLGDKLLTAEPLSLPDLASVASDVKHFTVTADVAAEIVRIRFPRIEEADRYLIAWGRGEAVTDWEANVRFNPYKGSNCFEADITAFSVPNGGKITLRLYALREGTPIAVSQDVTVDCPAGD